MSRGAGIVISRKQGGFTLLEVIIVLVLVSILGAYMIQMTYSNRYSSTAATWFSQEVTLQGLMERIVGEYKKGLSTTSGISLTVLKSFVETTAPYSGALVPAETGFVSFSLSGSNYVSSWPPTANPTAQTPVLVITFQQGDQKISGLFTQ